MMTFETNQVQGVAKIIETLTVSSGNSLQRRLQTNGRRTFHSPRSCTRRRPSMRNLLVLTGALLCSSRER